jgi:hypothetical protein
MYLKDGRARRYVPQGWKGKKVCTSRMEGQEGIYVSRFYESKSEIHEEVKEVDNLTS